MCLHVCVLYEPCVSNWVLTLARQLLGGLSYLLSPVRDLQWSLRVVSTVPEGKGCVWSLFWMSELPLSAARDSWRETLKVFTGPAVDTSMFAQLPLMSMGSDQSLPLALPNYRKNSVQSRKLVPRIPISSVGQWASCMGTASADTQNTH